MTLLRAVVVAVLTAGGARAELAPDAVGMSVGEVRFESPTTIDEADLRCELPLRSGQALSRKAVDASVARLQEKGIFESVEVDAVVRQGQAEVTFRLRPTPFVVAVAAKGERAIDEEPLLRRARIREDEPLSAEKIDAAKRRVVELYVEKGYPHAKVDIGRRLVRPGQIAVTVQVDEGSPVRIGEVKLAGIAGDWETGAREALHFRSGDVAAANTLGTGRDALLRFLRQRGFYEAEVVGTQSAADETLSFRYEAHLGPRFAIEVSGNRAIATTDLLGLTDLATRPVVTSGTWQLMALRMRERYREEGFHFAEVTVGVFAGDVRRIRFEVNEGPQVHVRQVSFRGNQALSKRDLERVMRTGQRPSLSLRRSDRGIFRRDLLDDDVEQIREHYRNEGYVHAEVSDAHTEFSEERRWVTVTLMISEGRQTRVGAVAVTGTDEAVPSLREGLALQPGEPFRPSLVEADRRLLVTRLGARGFVDAKVTPGVSAAVSHDGTEMVDVDYDVEPGDRVRIGTISIRDNYYTRDSVIRRALPFASGDLLDPAKLAGGQSDVYRLGLFRSVAVRASSDTGPVRDVTIDIGERPGGELLYGFGYDTRAGLRNFVQAGHKNVWGTGDQLSLRGDLNLAPGDLSPDEYILSLDGKQPHFFGSAYDLKGNVAHQRSQRSIDEFSIRRTSFSSGFEREFLHGLRASLMLGFEDSDIFDVHPDAVLTGKDVGRLRIVALNPIVLYDGRDDAFAPTRGVFESLRLRYGSPSFDSTVHFFKMILQHSQYVPLAAEVAWIYGGRFGLAEPLGASTTIPISERFFLGGRTSVRGYAENSIGPRGADRNPTGGDLLINVNSELRFPLFFGLGGAVFADGGGLYLREHAVSIGDFRVGLGPGLRYQTPVGTVSLDYGFKANPRSGESIGEVHFTIGNIF